MKTIIDDPEGFFESGGWSFLDPNSGSEDEKDEDEDLDSEDEEFKVNICFHAVDDKPVLFIPPL